MTQDTLLAKLASLARILERLEPRRHLSPETLASDPDQQDIVMLNLERAIQTCIDIAILVCARELHRPPANGGESFTILAESGLLPGELAERLRRSVGFRNLAVHEYTRIDFRIVCAVLQQGINDIKEFGRLLTGTNA